MQSAVSAKATATSSVNGLLGAAFADGQAP
jgi:hypothetical protein